MPKTKGDFITEAVQKRYSTITDGERKAKAAAEALENFRVWIYETCEEFFDLADDLGTVAERLRRQATALDARAAIHSKVPYGDGADVDALDALEISLNAAKEKTIDVGTDFEGAAIKIKLDEIEEIRSTISRAEIDYYNENGDFDDDDDDDRDDDDKNTD